MFLPQEFIRRKRDNYALDPDQINAFIRGVANDTISDAQIAAFCMAVFLNGLNANETAHLTTAMADSGTRLKWNQLNGPVIDKHSTGGVGDKVSLMLAPIVAACGLYVPMIAGRGLGHTGGTVDKLEAIPSYKTNLSITDFQRIVCNLGCAIIGQTAEFAPADGRLYAVRDVTATVENISLITASILSKKLAAGLQGLVMDIKTGNGAFMPTLEQAQHLADSLTRVATAADLPLKAVITDMNQVLGSSAGNTVEIIETIDYLTGKHRDPRLHDVTMTLAAEMILLGKQALDPKAARQKAQHALDNGRAAEIFEKMVGAQGGPHDLLDNPDIYLPKASVIVDVIADRDGYIAAQDTRNIGVLLVNFKAGRARVEDTIDPRIGITDIAPIGTKIEKGKTLLARFHLVEPLGKDIAIHSYLNCLTISDTAPSPEKIIHVA